MDTLIYHTPVMLTECLEALKIKPEGIYVDCTFGGGGHSRAILQNLSDSGQLLAFDQDPETLSNVPLDNRFELIQDNFSTLNQALTSRGIDAVDGIFADLGVSSHQLDEPSRGFSYRYADAVLDMRMNLNSPHTAELILNTYSYSELVRVFSTYGELPASKRLAESILETRQIKPFQTVGDLTGLAQKFCPINEQYSYFSQLFQALRIEVNQELEALKQLLIAGVRCLKRNGRLVILSYHSLEDRLVKDFINTGNFDGQTQTDFFGVRVRPLTPLYKKPLTPSTKEITDNPRARSAKLRVATKN